MMMLVPDAKKCPFCGGDLIIVERYGPTFPRLPAYGWSGDVFEPCCKECGARLGSSFASPDKAIKEWNKRAATDEGDFVVAVAGGHRWIRADSVKEVDCVDISKNPRWFVCSRCGDRTPRGEDLLMPRYCPRCGAHARLLLTKCEKEDLTDPALMTE